MTCEITEIAGVTVFLFQIDMNVDLGNEGLGFIINSYAYEKELGSIVIDVQ